MALKSFLDDPNDEIVPAYNPSSLDNTNLLIIDGNNLGYRYLKRKNYNSFREDYVRTVESLASSYACKDIVVAYDYGKSQYRLSLMPEYKGNRVKPDPGTDEDVHMQAFFKELNETAEYLPYQKFKLYGVEADDIIAYLVQKLKYFYKDVWIVSSDRDIYQLLDKQVHIFNLFSRKEINLDYLMKEKEITPDEYMLSRIIQGDSGDNIAGIAGIGEKRGQDIAKTHKTLANLLSKLPITPAKSQYMKNLNAGAELLKRNEKLISLLTHTREIITFGEGGEDHLKELESWCAPIANTYERIHAPDDIEKKISNLASIGAMTGLLQ